MPGLILFRFFLGLELDFRVMRRQLHVAAPIAVAAIAFPFAVGAISSLWLYDVNDQDEAGRTAFVLFFGKRVFGVALSLCPFLEGGCRWARARSAT